MLTKMRQIRWFKGLGYLFFGCVAFLLFFYLTFPFDLVQKKLIGAFEAGSDCRTQVGDQEVAIPFRLTWRQIHLLCSVGPPFTIESIEADLALLPLLFEKRGEIAFLIRIGVRPPRGVQPLRASNSAGAGDGEIVGQLKVNPVGKGFLFSLKEEGAGLDLNPIGLSGTLDMKGEGSWTGENILQGDGLFAFTLNDVKINPRESGWPMSDLAGLATLAGISNLSFSTVHGEMTWRKATVSIGRFYAEGESAELTNLGGDLVVRKPFSSSVVSTTFKIAPKGRLKQVAALLIPNYSGQEPFTLAITGVLTSPEVLINGKRLPTFS